MAPVANARVLFSEVPIGYPIPGKATMYDRSQTIDLEHEPLEGGVLIKSLALSIDPYLRGRMTAAHIKSFIPPFDLGEPMTGDMVGVVIRSEHLSLETGDHVTAPYLPWQEYSVVKDTHRLRKLPNKEGLPWSAYLGVIGMPGQTAYVGWKEFVKAKQGETVFVSGAAGSVGSLVVQIAKRDGLKVIASAGTIEKCDFLRSLGVDVVFNYKIESTAAVLKREGPIDIYWDNVGGETLDAAMENANKFGRIIECGMISLYNDPDRYHLKNMIQVIIKQLSFNGFLVRDWCGPHLDRFYEEMPVLVKEGKFRYQEDVTRGMEHAGEGLLEVLKGLNRGKKAILIADE